MDNMGIHAKAVPNSDRWEKIYLNRGIRQGDPPSPLVLFITVLDEALREAPLQAKHGQEAGEHKSRTR